MLGLVDARKIFTWDEYVRSVGRDQPLDLWPGDVLLWGEHSAWVWTVPPAVDERGYSQGHWKDIDESS